MEKSAEIDVRVSPKSSRSRITIDERDAIKVFLNSPPVDGKANEECIALFSRLLRVPKSSIFIKRGEKGKNKTLSIPGFTSREIIDMVRREQEGK